MLYLVIGLMVIVAVGAIITQRTRNQQPPENAAAGEEIGSGEVLVASQEAGQEVSDSLLLSHPSETKPTPVPAVQPETMRAETGIPEPELPTPQVDEIVPLKPLLAAAPLSSPNALSSATYSSVAPPALSSDSPYAYGNTEEAKPKPETTLLRWSGKMGSIQIGDLTVRGPVAYWSDGPSSTPEPSCIDIRLPVEYPGGDSQLPNEGAASYLEMTPLQRGSYLLWLAGGRIQPPMHVCHPVLWLFGLERRVLADRLDVGICIGEAFRLLPLIRWDSLRQSLIKFITWMAAKIWLPEEQLLAFCRSLPFVPAEILNMLLRSYGDAKLPLPSFIAFTIMRASGLAAEVSGGESLSILQHSDELLEQFAPKYKSKCQGGVVLSKPKSSIFVAYIPTNPSLSGDKNAVGGVLELPDFFKDTTAFEPLVAVWKEFLKSVVPASTAPLPTPDAREEVEARPDWESFVMRLRGVSVDEELPPDEEPDLSPVTTELGSVADLMGLERFRDDPERAPKKPGAADRKKINDSARVEGFLVLPNLGIAGKEYHWDDPVVLIPFATGTRLSQAYNAAALLLEFSCALAGSAETDELENLKTRLDDYFSLSSDDHARLDALSIALQARPAEPENIGECLQFWLQREQRGTVRDFLSSFLVSPFPEERRADLSRTICIVLDVGKDDPPPLESEESGKLDLGEKASKILAPLFKD